MSKILSLVMTAAALEANFISYSESISMTGRSILNRLHD